MESCRLAWLSGLKLFRVVACFLSNDHEIIRSVVVRILGVYRINDYVLGMLDHIVGM